MFFFSLLRSVCSPFFQECFKFLLFFPHWGHSAYSTKSHYNCCSTTLDCTQFGNVSTQWQSVSKIEGSNPWILVRVSLRITWNWWKPFSRYRFPPVSKLEIQCIYHPVSKYPVVHALSRHSLYPWFYRCSCLFFVSFRFLLVFGPWFRLVISDTAPEST